MKNQQLIIVISRKQLQTNLNLIPPFQIILPTLALLSPLRLFTTINHHQITDKDLYQGLVRNLEQSQGQANLSETLEFILTEKGKDKNFRVCIIGTDTINWRIIMKYKRMKILIDTGDSTASLSQISFGTGGINCILTSSTIVKTFLNIFSLNSQLRSQFQLNQENQIQFTVQCQCCQIPVEIKNQAYVCSVCLTIYCKNKRNLKCIKCSCLLNN